MNRMALHVQFPYKESRLKYLNCILATCIDYPTKTDVYVHTNIDTFPHNLLKSYSNGHIIIVHHGETNYLSWKARYVIDAQKANYSFTLYSDFDILIPVKALQYYLHYYEIMKEHKYNLGFIRTYNDKGFYYTKDHTTTIKRDYIYIKGERFIKIENPQCGLWIYDRNILHKWTEHPTDFDPAKIMKRKFKKNTKIEKCIPEKASYGLHFPGSTWFTDTIVPTRMNGNLLYPGCKVISMINNDNENRVQFHKLID